MTILYFLLIKKNKYFYKKYQIALFNEKYKKYSPIKSNEEHYLHIFAGSICNQAMSEYGKKFFIHSTYFIS